MRFLTIKLIMFWILLALSTHCWAVELTIQGIDSGEIKDNIQLYVKQVSSPIAEFDVDDYEQNVIQKVEKALQAFGYYNADIKIVPFTYEANGDFQLKVIVLLNDITLVNNVVLQAEYMTDPNAQTQNMPPKLVNVIEQIRAMQGKPLNHSRYETLKGQLSTFALLYGYFDFKFLLSKLLIIPTENPKVSGATVHWLFTLGTRYKFGELVFLQDTRGQLIANNVKPFKSGEFFDQSKIGQYSIDLASTGYFENALARANSERAVDYTVPIEVILKPKPKNLYQVGIGFSTDTKARVSLDWERPWVNIDGHSIGAGLYLSNPRKSLSLDYRIPKANPLNDFLNYRVSLQQTEENQTKSDKLAFEVLRQWGANVESGWDKIGFLKLERETFIQGLQEEKTTKLVMPGVTFNRTRKDGDLFVHWGDRQQLTMQGASKSLLSDIDFFQILAKTKWIREYGIHRLTLRADAGAIYTNDFSRVPSTLRFFAGGDQSIRGFGFNKVSELVQIEVDGELENELIGGKYLAVASVEYAFKVAENWRAAAFVDAGSANNKFASDISTGVGVGAHWLSPIGDVQIYIARGNSSFEKSWRLHIVIGPGL